jgi:hypothetical protein
MNIHPPKSIIILFAGMAAISVAANFLKGAGMADAVQIVPNVVMSQSEETPAVTSSVQTSLLAPSAPIVPLNITPRPERESREDD